MCTYLKKNLPENYLQICMQPMIFFLIQENKINEQKREIYNFLKLHGKEYFIDTNMVKHMPKQKS